MVNYHNDISKSKLNGANIKNEIADISETIEMPTNANENIESRSRILSNFSFWIVTNDDTLPWILIGLSTSYW